ncbi:hypothetical protein IWQ60_010720 [Tieghemiomyces parasiticus]|uniref:Uncharacterized protein n=1 Tax=Tieghemiomyces parasiticus TaxID=78921 RepID=A0A9W7ZQ26_9FUNG|nr:hypothetical protein IWQ60_010720 [Tieghemiomyces parasiticus]
MWPTRWRPALWAVLCTALVGPRLAHTAFTVKHTNQMVPSHDLALYGDSHDHSSKPYDARLIQISLDDQCQFTMQGQTAYQLDVGVDASATEPLVALVNSNHKCTMVLHTLFACRQSSDTETKAILAAVKVLVFVSNYSSDYDVGGISEELFKYYQDALPFDVDDLMVVGSDSADTLRQVLADADDRGVSIHVIHDESPWNIYYHSATWAGIRWSFFVVNLLAALYIAYHIGITFIRKGFFTRDRYLIRITSAFLLLLHLVFYMACPVETATTRANAMVRRLSVGVQSMAYSFLLMQWARVVLRIYNWRYIRVFYWYTIFMVGYTTVYTICSATDVYVHQSLQFAAFITVMNYYLSPGCVVIEIAVIIHSAVLISRTQWAQRKNGAGPMALVKLTYLINLSCLGYIIMGMFSVLESTVWRPPRISLFIAKTVFAQVFSFISAAAIFWTLTAASKVRSSAGGSTSGARHHKANHSIQLDGFTSSHHHHDHQQQQQIHGMTSSQDSTLPLGTDLDRLGSPVSEKPHSPLSFPDPYSDLELDAVNAPAIRSWHDMVDEPKFQPGDPDFKILL